MHFEDIALKKDSATVGQQLFEVCKKLLDDLEIQKLPRQSTTATPSQKGNIPVDTSELKSQIDQLVYQLYDLTVEEIGVVEVD